MLDVNEGIPPVVLRLFSSHKRSMCKKEMEPVSIPRRCFLNAARGAALALRSRACLVGGGISLALVDPRSALFLFFEVSMSALLLLTRAGKVYIKVSGFKVGCFLGLPIFCA